MNTFNQLQFQRELHTRDTIQKSKFEFFVPGVNSGIYSPATLYVGVQIQEKKARFFNFKSATAYASITLNKDEFDELFAEMEKIKKLRDALK